MDERRERLYIATGGICEICHQPLGTDYERHHSQHDTDGNNENFPLYTKSMIGFKALHKRCHEKNPGFGRIPQAHVELWEMFLSAFKGLIKAGAEIPLHLVFEELLMMKKGGK